MNQSVVAGIILILLGLFSAGKPKIIWQITEKWESQEAGAPSTLFILITRISGGVLCVLVVLLLLGVVK